MISTLDSGDGLTEVFPSLSENRNVLPLANLGVWGKAQIVISVGVRTQRESVTQSGKSLLKILFDLKKQLLAVCYADEFN